MALGHRKMFTQTWKEYDEEIKNSIKFHEEQYEFYVGLDSRHEELDLSDIIDDILLTISDIKDTAREELICHGMLRSTHAPLNTTMN